MILESGSLRDGSHNGNKDRFISSSIALVLLKTLRTYCLYGAGMMLWNALSVSVFVFFAMGVSSVFFLSIHYKSWNRLKGNHWKLAFGYGILILLNMFAWCQALKYYGPLRVLLSLDYADFAWLNIFSLCFGKKISARKGRGAILLLLGYTILFFFGALTPATTTTTEETTGLDTENINTNETNSSNSFISQNLTGGFWLLLTIIFTITRKKVAKLLQPKFRLSNNVKDAGGKLLLTMGVTTATILSFPYGLIQLFTDSDLSFSLGSFFWTVFIILFLIVFDYYMESFSRLSLPLITHVRSSLMICFFGALFFDPMLPSHIPPLSYIVAFLLILAGFTLSIEEDQKNLLPLTTNNISNNILPISQVKVFLYQIWNSPDSKKIFIFFTINLSFMMIEFFYGCWTNSLGLISDSFHMMFDCMGLAIGLCASVIKNWGANSFYTYGVKIVPRNNFILT